MNDMLFLVLGTRLRQRPDSLVKTELIPGRRCDFLTALPGQRQKFNDAIPAGLPTLKPAIRVAHKTGNITRIHHDGGIVFARRPYVLVVLVRGIQEQKESAALMAAISRAVYSRLNP